jgi:two-component system, OmpR family, sensor histidine kinase CpxA
MDVRVADDIGKRHDEISELGKDFDRMAEHLQKLMLAQKQLLSDVSHEIRSPLARLQVAVGLTRQKANNNISREIDRIEREIVRLDELVGQVLTLSQLEVGTEKPKEDYVDIALLLEEIVKDADFEAVNNNRHVVLKSQQTWILRANTELLHRALENIIRNAVCYTAEASEVIVSLQQSRAEQDFIEIQICDCGVGVDNDKLTQLFEPFVRISDSRNRDTGGYGLGLAIAERAIHLHQGKVFAQNRDQAGLCVTVLLPIPDSNSQPN